MEALVGERRRHQRVSCDVTEWRHMRLRTGDPLTIVDIGDGGALVESARRLLPGAVVAVNLVAQDRALTLEARVVRCSVSWLESGGGVRYRGALEFVREQELCS